MADFSVVERFDPTKSEEVNADDEKEQILDQLKKKIEKRKLEDQNKTLDESIEEIPSKKKKKKKKRDAIKENSTPENEDTTEPLAEENVKPPEKPNEKPKYVRNRLYIKFISETKPSDADQVKALHPAIKNVKTSKPMKNGTFSSAYLEFSNEEECVAAKDELSLMKFNECDLIVDFQRQKDKSKAAIAGFTLLGEDLPTMKKKKVKRFLPNWLLNPDVSELDYLANRLPIKEMEGFDTGIQNALGDLGFEFFFPVQSQVIPFLLKPHVYRPHDVCVSAPTGSGKTLTYVLPIVQRLKSRVVPKVRAIVMLPNEILAAQVFDVFNVFASNAGLSVQLLNGKKTVTTEQKSLYTVEKSGLLRQLADILVVIPSQLVYHLRYSKELDLTALRFLVIDEADKMIDNITDEWLTRLESAVFSKGRPRPGPLTLANMRKNELPLQKLLFSATLAQDPDNLERINLFEPKLFRCIVPPKDLDGKIEDYDLGDIEYSIPTELEQYSILVEPETKPLLVKCIIDKLQLNSVLIFTKSQEATHRLALLLTNLGVTCGDFSVLPGIREKAAYKDFEKFKSGEIKILIAPDALTRGIDIEHLEAVISYDQPVFINSYVNRIGRTGRAGRKGTSVIMLQSTEAEEDFNKMISNAGLPTVQSINIDKSEYSEQMDKYYQALEATKRAIMNNK